MANKSLFGSTSGRNVPVTDVINEAGGGAYAFSPKHALAQYASTGCLNSTFYVTAETQLDKIRGLCNGLDPEFIAKTAVYCRQRGFMKDVPALLCAILAHRDVATLERVFDRVIDNGKMLRNFVQIVRSGVAGRRSLGSAPRRLVRNWFEARSDDDLFRASIGRSPSMADVIKMTHPRPRDAGRQALFGYMIGRDHDKAALPETVRAFEAFKRGDTEIAPDVPFQFLTSLNLSRSQWEDIARHATWQTTRMNLNTFLRHGVFSSPEMVTLIANRLRDERAIKRARAFPYQLLAAYRSVNDGVPREILTALEDAMEIATSNVPHLQGKVFILVDVSGSMHSPITGQRAGSTSKVTCVEVAALFAAALLRKNRDAEVIAFSDDVVRCRLTPRDTIMTNARKLASLPSGGTNCSAPLKMLNRQQAKGDMVIYVSDNESWVDWTNRRHPRGTATMAQWSSFSSRNRDARLVCIDLQPTGSTQATERGDILNIGGFSDSVFEIVNAFSRGRLGSGHFVGEIERIEI